MLSKKFIPHIQSPFNSTCQGRYQEIIQEILEKILPTEDLATLDWETKKQKFCAALPLITTASKGQDPWQLSFYLLAKSRLNIFKFFFEMISRWLVPGKKINVGMIYAVDLKLPEISHDLYTLCEIIIQVDKSEELALLLKNFSTLQSEIRLGLKSSYYARKILECKGIPLDEKIVAIQEHIATLIQRRPNIFDIELLSTMQQTLLLCSNDFKKSRASWHLSKIIALQHLFSKTLIATIKQYPSKRHFYLKSFLCEHPSGPHILPTLCLLVGINFIRDKEIIEKQHLLQAIQACIPNAEPVEEAFFVNRHTLEPFALFYIEIKKSDLDKFSQEEILLLKEKLARALTERIQHLVHPVFMPRNEEEIMRNIINLSNEIRSPEDLPQVFITFDEQTSNELSFTVIIVRIMPPGGQTIQERFIKTHPHIHFVHDRIKMIGLLRKKQAKEASVCHIHIPKEPYLRVDHSLDLYKARQEITELLYASIGEFRDFNGGMIRKQTELLENLKDILADGLRYSKLLLETFFFSLTPAHMQSILEAEALKALFHMLLNAIESGFPNHNCHRIQQDLNYIFLLVKVEPEVNIENLNKAFKDLCKCPTELAQTSVNIDDIRYDGYIYRCTEPLRQQQFLHEAERCLSRSKANALN